MTLSESDFEEILGDVTKTIHGDLEWSESDNHVSWLKFRADIDSEDGYPLSVAGSYNPIVEKVSFALIYGGVGRVYALDLGVKHHNPTCENVGDTHKHRWTDCYRDKLAYEPDDITATVAEPVAVWEQFCDEALIDHDGTLAPPPALQTEIFE